MAQRGVAVFRNEDTYWVSTGLYPQDLLVAFDKPSVIDRLECRSRRVKRMAVERCETPQPLSFQPVCEIDLESHDGEIQVTSRPVMAAARYIKIRILEGYDDIVAVHNVVAEGRQT
ncbi:hypothetical protein PBRA_007123 [Plasmodiophora brassicae]|uniref:Uncharacterized protein n=1 Tax=Plasmodiophora brassicae TaxID=37360 RepID=A0A0G4IV27_PLABS|nr:hypothetical protein PBRA_007123 [Plasmodiophora brassicae]